MTDVDDQDLRDAIRFGRTLSDRLLDAKPVRLGQPGGEAAAVAAGILLALSHLVDAVCDVLEDAKAGRLR